MGRHMKSSTLLCAATQYITQHPVSQYYLKTDCSRIKNPLLEKRLNLNRQEIVHSRKEKRVGKHDNAALELYFI